MTLRRAILPLFVLAALAGAGVACSRAADTSTASCTGEASSATPIDNDVMAFLSAARALHHEADLDEDAKDLRGAIGAMDRLVKLPRPHPGVRVVEVEEVLSDAYARKAELLIRTGALDDAQHDVDEGLTHAVDPTYFRGHLLEVDGLVEKARAGALADAGRTDEAEAAKQRAIDLLHESVKVQEQVIERSLGDGGRR